MTLKPFRIDCYSVFAENMETKKKLNAKKYVFTFYIRRLLLMPHKSFFFLCFYLTQSFRCIGFSLLCFDIKYAVGSLDQIPCYCLPSSTTTTSVVSSVFFFFVVFYSVLTLDMVAYCHDKFNYSETDAELFEILC